MTSGNRINKIAVIFGAQSYEHEISIVSSIAMKKVINHELIYIFIDENREFYHIPTDIIKSKLFSSKEYKKQDILTLKKGGFFKKSFFGETKLEFDVLLNLTHGGDGEDGVLASLFEFFDIPFIGPRNEACAVSFNKLYTKMYAKELGVRVIDYKVFNKYGQSNFNALELPVIIKPARLGSSIGVSVVKEKEALEYAFDVAFEFDETVIAEPFIENIKEYNLAGTKIDGEFVFSIIEEPQKNEFLDFDKKYLDFNRTTRVNEADISVELTKKLKEAFKNIYNTAFEGSLIRCDFFVIDEDVYLNEINPIPGSMANYLFDDFNAVITSLAKSLPRKKHIKINYDYVNKIQNAKGK